MGHEFNYTGRPQIHYGPSEVVVHNKPTDCWVSILNKVLNITPLIEEHEGEDCIRPLLTFAGKDISEWFEESTGDIRYHVHPVSSCRVPYLPHGRIPDVEVQVPATGWKPLDHIPWWKDDKYKIGLLTKRARPIRIINPLFGLETYMTVCSEDTILRIKERYSIYNSNAHIYLWKYFDKVLDDNLNLEDNGIPDERDKFAQIGLSPTFHIPAIFIYFLDDYKWCKLDSDDSDYEP